MVVRRGRNPCYQLLWSNAGGANGRNCILEFTRHGVISGLGTPASPARPCGSKGPRPTDATGTIASSTNCVTEKRRLSRRLIQIFNRYLEPGGEEAWVANLEKSFDLPTCYFNSSDWVGANAPSYFSQALRMIHNPVSLQKLRMFQEETQAEAWILHNAFPTGSAAVYPEAGRNRIPLIQYIHNFRPIAVSGYLNPSDLANLPSRLRTYLTEVRRGSWRDSRIKTAWFASVLSIAKLLGWFNSITVWIAVSDFMRDQFIRAGIPSEKIFTLRHFWRPIADLSYITDEGYYLFMGRLVEMKGVLILLDVWDLIWRDRRNAGPRLVICGDGPLRESVQARAATNPLVVFKGTVSGEVKNELLRGARAIVAPSLCLESLGLVAYEAYDFAKPVLASRAGGLAETVSDGVTGLIHEPGDAETLCEQVLNLEREPQKGIEFGRNGRQWLLEHANVEKWREEFNRIVEFAISKKT